MPGGVFKHLGIHAIIPVGHLHVPGTVLGGSGSQGGPPCPPGVYGHAGTGSSTG